jgi:phage gp36-like protein
MSDEITVSVTMPTAAAWELATFCKLAKYKTFYDLTDPHLSDEKRRKQADEMVAGIEAVLEALVTLGVDRRAEPRAA